MFFAVFFVGLLAAQDISCSFRTLTVTNGLSNPTVISIAQDERSYVWLATNDGINRYDGINVRQYFPARNLDPETSTRDLPVLHAGSSGEVWLGYHQAKTKLFRYDTRRDTFLSFAPGVIPEDVGIVSLHEEVGKSLWVGTSKLGLYRFDLASTGTDPIIYHHYRAVSGDTTTLPIDFMGPGLHQQANGILWIATERGLTRHLPGTDNFKTFQWAKQAAGNEILGLGLDEKRGCLWLATNGGLVRFDTVTEEFSSFLPPGQRAGEAFYMSAPRIAPDGRVWFNLNSFPASKLSVFDPKREVFLQPVSLASGKTAPLPGAYDIYCDARGNVWSGGIRRGLQIINPTLPNVRRVPLPRSSGLLRFNPKEITALAEMGDGRFFLGTKEQGLWHWDQTESSLSPLPLAWKKAAPYPRVYDLALAPDQRSLYAIAGQLLYRIDLATGRSTTLPSFSDFPDYSRHLRIRFFTDRLWLSSFAKGTAVLTPGKPAETLRFFNNVREAKTTQPPFAFGSITDLQPGTNPGQLWLATVFAGLLEWDEAKQDFTQHAMSHTIRRLYVAPDGLLWLATDSGLLRYDPRGRKMITEPSLPQEGLHFPRSLTADGQGLLWVAAEKGIMAIDPLSAKVKHRFLASAWLDTEEQWYAPEMFTYYHEAKGEVYFANERGFFHLRPDEIRYDSLPPKLVLQECRLNGRRQRLPDSTAVLGTFPYHQNDLILEVGLLHFRSPEGNRLRYRLENFDADWRTARPGQLLEYPKLPPGKYRLLATASNADGATGSPRELISFRIRRPWFANPWAYGIYLALFMSLVAYVFRQQILRREQKNLEALDAAKTHLFTNISHEFRTPLTLILGDGQALAAKLENGLRERAQRIQHGGQRLLWLVNQLLELAQADSGFLRLEPKQADIIPFLRYNLQAFESLTGPRDIKLLFESKFSEKTMDFDVERLQRILSNILLNAVKSSPDGGLIKLQADTVTEGSKEQLRLRITDTGPGIPAGELPLVFDRFHRATRQQGGVGIGLALVRELVLLMKGDVSAANAPGGGAVFTLLLPVSRSAPLEQVQQLDETRKWPGILPIIAPAAAPSAPKEERPELPQVLIIEDNEDLRPFLRACLADHYQLTLARDGQEGLELAFDREFDLIISDVMMPRMDGFTVCKRLKENPETSHLPIILMTARADQDSRLEGLQQGADVYLPKPFDPRELQTRCVQLLRQRERLRAHYRHLLSEEQAAAIPPEFTAEAAFITEVRAAVVQRLDDHQLSVDELAAAVNISRSNLYRRLVGMVGISPTHFIRTVRLEAAKKLLKDPSLTVAEVAYACGFRDPDYFSRVFREELGQSPSAYRRQGK